MKYVLSDIFGESREVKILETLAENFDNPISRADISKVTDISKSTVNRYFEKLIKKEMVVEKGKLGKAILYQLNLENEIALKVTLLENSIVTGLLEDKIVELGEIPISKHLAVIESKKYQDVPSALKNVGYGVPSIEWAIKAKPEIHGWSKPGSQGNYPSPGA